MKLELGKRYLTRDGRVTTHLEKNTFGKYSTNSPFKAYLNGEVKSWGEDGVCDKHYGHTGNNDLVQEYYPPQFIPAPEGVETKPIWKVGPAVDEVIDDNAPRYVFEDNSVYRVGPNNEKEKLWSSAWVGAEAPERKIRRLEHNIEVMRDSYLPARLEIASRLMAALYTHSDSEGYGEDRAVRCALSGADALIAEYQKTEPHENY